MFYGIDNILGNILHIQTKCGKYKEYSLKYDSPAQHCYGGHKATENCSYLSKPLISMTSGMAMWGWSA